jgi:hypothetical protein
MLHLVRGCADGIRKIDEPKTPYVRYDAENDLILSGKLSYLSHERLLMIQTSPDSTCKAVKLL